MRGLRRTVVIGGLAAGVALVVLMVALWEGDIPDLLGDAAAFTTSLLARHGVPAAFGLLYLEESGLLMPVPGDVFVMYVGHRVGGDLGLWVGAWLGFVVCVVLGASNLYFLSRRYGRRMAEGRLGALMHLSPERLLWAETTFQRWGVLAIIVGRHIPGLRVPITVAAGVLQVPYHVFVLSAAVSTAVWAGVFLFIGFQVGDEVARFLGLHRTISFMTLPAATLLFVGGTVWLLLSRRRRA